MKDQSLMIHWTRATLTAVMLSTLTGCSSVTPTTLLSGATTSGLSKTEIQQRFGTPTGSGTTSAGRQTETYRIQKERKSGSEYNKYDRPAGNSQDLAACIQLLPICLAVGLIVYAIQNDQDKSDIAFVYEADGRVLFYYDTKAAPPERYYKAISPMPHPLDNIEEANCPKLKVCVERYIDEARKRAEEVGYSLTEEDEKSFHTDLEMAGNVDEGKVTKEEAFRQKCATHGYTDHRKPSPASPDLYNAIHKLTDRLLNEIKDGRGSMKNTVAGYVEKSRDLMTGFNRRLTCTDEETFQEALQIAKDVDDGKVTRDDAYSKLLRVTTHHLIRLYQGRG